MLDLRRPLCDSQCLRSRKSHTLHPTSTFQRFQRPSSPESLPRRASCHPLTTPPKTTQTFPRSPQPHSSPPPKIPTPTNRHRYPHHPQPQRDLTLITPSLPRPSAPHPPRSPPPHPIPPLPRPRPHPRLRRRHPGRQKPHAGPRARVVRARRRCWFGWRVGRRGRRRRKKEPEGWSGARVRGRAWAAGPTGPACAAPRAAFFPARGARGGGGASCGAGALPDPEQGFLPGFEPRVRAAFEGVGAVGWRGGGRLLLLWLLLWLLLR